MFNGFDFTVSMLTVCKQAYRSEDFSRALSIYKELNADPAIAHEADDLRINLLAVEARLQTSGKHDLPSSRHPRKSDLELFESAYNLACGAIERGDFLTAEMLLKRTAGQFSFCLLGHGGQDSVPG